MTMSPACGRFHPLSIGAHWLTLLLLVSVYALIELHAVLPKGGQGRELTKLWHEMLGLIVLGIVFVRLVLRAVCPAPAIEPAPSAWQDSAARMMHITLYAFLIAMPVLGWLLLSAKGKPVPFFGLELPALMAPDKSLARRLDNIHEVVGRAGYFLISLHAAAALWHHSVMRDNALLRMLPLLQRSKPVQQTRRQSARFTGAMPSSRSISAECWPALAAGRGAGTPPPSVDEKRTGMPTSM